MSTFLSVPEGQALLALGLGRPVWTAAVLTASASTAGFVESLCRLPSVLNRSSDADGLSYWWTRSTTAAPRPSP